MKHHLFISHENSSLLFVENLAKMFESNDVYCWYAPRDLDQSSAGKEYDDELVDAIHEASAIVVILNDLALQSIWVKREVSQAEKQGKMIYPFVVSQLTINNGLLMRLEDKHLINAYPDPESKLPVLLKNVKQLLGQDVSAIKVDETEEKSNTTQPLLKNTFDFDFDEGVAFLEADEDRDAFLAFLRSAENGSSMAQEQLFKILFRNSKDMSFLDESTWEHIEELSDSGEAYADFLMHYKYYGMGTQNDIAIKYLKRALSKQVSPYVFLQMGICYGWGLGVNASGVLEMLYYKKAYDAGCVDACSYIGQLYLWGSEKINKDLQKAEEILREGSEKGVTRCFDKLFSLYINKKEYDKATEVLQYMIDHNVKGGYTLMANYYHYMAPEDKRDMRLAVDWYKQAIDHNEKDAWGNLAWIYWDDGDHDEAYRMAQKGCLENDSFSYHLLGYFYEQDAKDDNYSKAWDCYRQRVQRFGNDASPMANLYINYGYLPDNYSIEELKQLLNVDAKLHRIGSIVCLLKIMLKEQGKEPSINYDALCDFPESYEYIRIGAEQVDTEECDTELMYIYGRLLIEKSGKLHNPYRGIEIILSASKKGDNNATNYAFKYYSQKKDKAKLSELADNMIQSKTYPIDYLHLIIDYGRDVSNPENFGTWVSGAIERLSGKDRYMQLRFQLYQVEMELYKKGVKDLSDDDITIMRKDIDTNIQSINMFGWLLLLKDYMDVLYPDYNPKQILNGDYSNKRDFAFFYGINKPLTTFNSNNMIITNNDCEAKIYQIIENGISADNKETYSNEESFSFRRAYGNVLYAYNTLIEDGKAIKIEEKLELDNKIIEFYFPSELAIHYCQLALKMLIASKGVYGDNWQSIINCFDNQDKLLDIAEITEDESAQLLLISFVETYIDGDSIIFKNNRIRTAYQTRDKKYICDELNKCVEEMDKHNIKHDLNHFIEDNLPETLFEKN